MEDTSKDSKDEWPLHRFASMIRKGDNKSKIEKKSPQSFIGIFFILSSQSDCFVKEMGKYKRSVNYKTNLQQGMTLGVRQGRRLFCPALKM